MNQKILTQQEEQTVALAAIFQNCQQVQQLATTGQYDAELLDTAVEAVINTEPENTMDVFKHLNRLTPGFKLIEQQLNASNKQNRNMELTRYTISVLFLSSKLLKNSPMLKQISIGLDKTRHQIDHFGLQHENIHASLGGLYTETISLLKPRIMVSGEPVHLNNSNNANIIRTFLLAAIRCAILWNQLGGSRWQLIFKRKKILQTAHQLQ